MEKKTHMKDYSSLSPMESFIEYTFWNFIMFIYYNNILFIPLNDCSVSKSKFILVGVMFITSIIGSAIRWRRCMTTIAVFADIMIGAGIYTMLAYGEYYTALVRVLLLIFATFFIAYVCFVFSRKIKGKNLMQIRNKRRKWFIIKSRLVRSMSVSGLILGLIMVVFMIPVTYNRIVHGGIIALDADYSDTSGFDSNYAENEYSLTHNIESISKIRTDAKWEPLTIREKLEVLQDICNCESNYWGMDFKVSITMDDLEENTQGAYIDSERRVVIDRQYLENGNAEEIFKTVLHEMYHAWQYTLVRLYMDSSDSQKKMRVFMHCEEYVKEMMDYQDGTDGYLSFIQYYDQHMEEDSRDYAEMAVKQYYDEIDEILKE